MSQPNNSAFGQGGNQTPMPQFINYTPVLTGATDNPVPTFSTQVGRFFMDGARCFFKFKLVSTTMTKTTLTDLVNVSLPIAAATNVGEVTVFPCRLENAAAVANMMLGEIASAASVFTLRNY